MSFGDFLNLAGKFINTSNADSTAAKNNALVEEENALKREQHEWEKNKEAPAVLGAQDQLQRGAYVGPDGQPITAAQYEALDDATKANYKFQSQFQPFQDANVAAAAAAGNIAADYMGDTGAFHTLGNKGLLAYDNLGNMTYEDQKALADRYAADYGQGAYDIAAKDINREAQAEAFANARRQGRFGALSSQKARQGAYTEQAREDNLLRAAERARQTGFDRAQNEIKRQQELAGTFVDLGGTGLTRAASAADLASGAIQQGVSSPFLPFQEYGKTVGSVTPAQTPSFGKYTANRSYGLGSGWGG